MPVQSYNQEDYADILNLLKCLGIIHNPNVFIFEGDFNVDLSKEMTIKTIVKDFICLWA